MEARHLEEIEVEQGDVRIRLRKGGAPPVVVPIAARRRQPRTRNAVPAAAEAEKAAEANLVKITSPMVGTFYRAASPDAEPFINEGDHVTPDQVVCIIEAMKVMNEIKAESGRRSRQRPHRERRVRRVRTADGDHPAHRHGTVT